MALRVLHVTASASYGGGGEHLWQLLRQLPGHGVSSCVAAPRDEPYWQRFTDCVGACAMLEIPHRSFRPGALFALAAFARGQKADLLHSHGKGAGLYARLAGLITGIACVHTFHGIHHGNMPACHWWLYRQLERSLGRATRACIAVSAGEREQILRLGFCSPERLNLIPNGVLCPPQEAGPAPEERRDIIHATRFDPAQKNSEALVPIALALRRAGRLQRFRFVVLGTGPRRAALEMEVDRQGLRKHFIFPGAVPSIRPFLKQAFCCLSTSRWEGLPLALLEAMSEGVPVAATDVVGNRDAVEHGRCGLLFPADAPAEAARAVLRLCDGPGLWARLSQGALCRAREQFDVETMATATATVYRATTARLHRKMQ